MQKRELCKHDCKYIYIKKEKSNLMFNIFLSSFCSITKKISHTQNLFAETYVSASFRNSACSESS